jgi:hypothetical protein
MELNIVESHTRALTAEDVQDPSVMNHILRAGDVVHMANAIESYKAFRFNMTMMGSALRKIYGRPVKGMTVTNLINVDGHISKEKYAKSELRSNGFHIFFSERPLSSAPVEAVKYKQRSGAEKRRMKQKKAKKKK